MKSGWRVPILFRAALLLLVATPVCRAAWDLSPTWDLTPAGDPSRNWNVAAVGNGTYDDNFNGTENNRQSGFRYTSDLILQARVPWQRVFVAAKYDYGIEYPSDIKLGGVNQSHNLNISGNYTVNPRLLLAVNENFVSSVQPQLVVTAAGVPPTVTIAGTYVYDTAGASASYSLTPRWTASVAGTWDIWRYDEALYATNNDHEDYSTTLSLNYAINTRTIVGVNYQYTEDTYTNPGPKNSLNGDSNTGYLSLTHQFNPKLALVLNGGYTVRNSGDGSTSTAPSAYGSLNYNYGPKDLISLVAAEALSSASVGITRSFSAQESTTLALQVNHQFTTALHTSIGATYAYSTFTSQVVGQNLVPLNVTPSDQAITAHWGIGYDFQKWLSAQLSYDYTRLISSNANLVPPFSRDQISLGMTLSY